METKHTFLFQEGRWEAVGDYFDEGGNRIPFVGESTITHTEELWLNVGVITLQVPNEIMFTNTYEFVPLAEGEHFGYWQSTNPSLGTLMGKIVIIDDAILTSFNSKSGEYEGFEYLVKVNDKHYRNKGVLYMGNMKLSSWMTELKKVR